MLMAGRLQFSVQSTAGLQMSLAAYSLGWIRPVNERPLPRVARGANSAHMAPLATLTSMAYRCGVRGCEVCKRQLSRPCRGPSLFMVTLSWVAAEMDLGSIGSCAESVLPLQASANGAWLPERRRCPTVRVPLRVPGIEDEI